MSLQTGKELAKTDVPIINPHDLSIMGYKLSGSSLGKESTYLRIEDIREIGNLGMIVDSSDEFLEIDDIITKRDIYDLKYELIGKDVYTEDKVKLGKIADYTIDLGSFTIQQLVVRRPLLKSFKNDELLIRRTQVVAVTDENVVVRSTAAKESSQKNTGGFVNPFKHATSPQTESTTHASDAN